MSPAEFRAIRHRLGLSVAEMAQVLDVRPDYVRHMEMDPSKKSAVPVSGPAGQFLAYLDRTKAEGDYVLWVLDGG